MASIQHSKTLKDPEFRKKLLVSEDSFVNWKRQMDSPVGAGVRPSQSHVTFNSSNLPVRGVDAPNHNRGASTSLPADTHEVLTRLSAVERGQEAIVSELKDVAQGLSALRLTMVDQASTVDLSDVRCTSAFGCAPGTDAAT